VHIQSIPRDAGGQISEAPKSRVIAPLARKMAGHHALSMAFSNRLVIEAVALRYR